MSKRILRGFHLTPADIGCTFIHMKNAKQLATTEFAVLLYPPHGRPRVVELPKVDPEIAAMFPMARYDKRTAAEAALEKFLTDNPEYRNWDNGRIVK
jgi:hypothetical protein